MIAPFAPSVRALSTKRHKTPTAQLGQDLVDFFDAHLGEGFATGRSELDCLALVIVNAKYAAACMNESDQPTAV